MKSLILTIIASVALNLAAGSCAVAQEPPETEDQKMVERSMEVAKRQMEVAQKQMERAKKVVEAAQEKTRRIVLDTRLSKSIDAFLEGSTWRYGGGRVLVIPTAEVKAEELVTIMEDLSVMSRILDKKLKEMRLSRDYDYFYGYNFLEWNLPVTKSIYLEGYGVLFLKKVNFPLSPPVELAEKETKEDLDAVWEQTKRQMYFRKDILKPRRKKRSKEKYDAQKVENLKETIFKALRHTSNIRNLKANEWVILTVIGEGGHAGDVSHGYGIASGGCSDCDEPCEADIHIAGAYSQADHKCLAEAIGFPSPTVLTIRIKKSDVDAFSKDELSFDQFRQRAKILTY